MQGTLARWGTAQYGLSTMRTRAIALSVGFLINGLALAAGKSPSGKVPTAVNVTGTWSANFSGGMDLTS